MRGKGINADDVDIALIKLTEAASLWALAAPYALHLVAFKRENQFVIVLRGVARQWNGLVKVQSKARFFVAIFFVQAFDDINLFVHVVAFIFALGVKDV